VLHWNIFNTVACVECVVKSGFCISQKRKSGSQDPNEPKSTRICFFPLDWKFRIVFQVKILKHFAHSTADILDYPAVWKNHSCSFILVDHFDFISINAPVSKEVIIIIIINVSVCTLKRTMFLSRITEKYLTE
jgi:hypothetical protein